jgi:hypothetical protein
MIGTQAWGSLDAALVVLVMLVTHSNLEVSHGFAAGRSNCHASSQCNMTHQHS